MFEVFFHRRVLKFLEKLREEDKKRILQAIEKLSNPFSQSYEKLRGKKNIYRIVVGDYRIIHHVDKKNKIVSILLVDKRESLQSFITF